MNFYQYLPSYVSSLQQFPDVVALAAKVASMAMLGQAAGKILIGIINDKISVRGGLFFAMICGLAGLGVLLLFFGWFGFNGASSFDITSEATYIALVSTFLGGAVGALATMFLTMILYKNCLLYTSRCV